MKACLLSGLSVIAVAVVVQACGDDHGHSHSHAKRSQPGATQPTSWPSSPLVWGDINFIHTTDSHGHQKSSYPNRTIGHGDFGDFSSFVTHLKKEAERRNVDLLLVDSGDLHDGTGLSDGFPAGGVDGHESNKLIQELPYDVLAIGNHELYIYPVTLDMYESFAPYWNGRYLSSNVNITVTDKKTGIWYQFPLEVADLIRNFPRMSLSDSASILARYRKFETLRGRKVTAFGVLFNFKGNAANTTVQLVEDMVNETWFKMAIQEEPDFFLLVGHMPVQRDHWPNVFNAIRSVHPYTPIFIFGGHTHIRDCVQLDTRSMSLESGRYMETVGWMSAKLDDKNSTAPLNITRRYLDPNRNTCVSLLRLYKYHTQLRDFDTRKGHEISQQILTLTNKFNLSYIFGTAPQDYFLSRAPFPSNNSLFSLLTDKLLPTVLPRVNPVRAQAVPSIAIINSGSQRFDLYAGPFSCNDQFVVSPFTNKFLYFSVPYSIGRQILNVLNAPTSGGSKRSGSSMLADYEDPAEYARGNVDARFNQWKRAQWERAQQQQANDDHKRGGEHWGGHYNPHHVKSTLTLGYVTKDSCPGVGDDTLHTPLPYYPSPPDYIASPLPTGLRDDSQMDVIFLDFFASSVVSALNQLQSVQTYSVGDAKAYGDLSTNTMFDIYAQIAWN
ncbi:hypothetical protein BS47DRAFT_1370749 [Hydnum rufescens UP504]|uniref:Putative 5'-nucleotidase C-terminal domain-containing protein n=1 Tax=Hydnum rufescens UP504 TaxID=1448309 RepID=A0A9P6E1D9_9AGAM|nr:hypothetical protein BS47DRAFT_1370749 [Hydnum rufescens UP504]